MQKFVMVALATTLMSTTAMGGERTVTVPTPKSITIVCSDDVRQGTVVLSNPPKFSCKDYELVKSAIGTGITVGPDANVNRITAALRRAKRVNEVTVTKKNGVETYDNGRSIVRWRNNDNRATSLDDFGGSSRLTSTLAPRTTRNSAWFNEAAPVKVSDDPSGRCTGWVNLNDILNEKCGKLQATVKVDGISVESK